MGRTATLPIHIGCAGPRTLQEQIYASIRRSIVSGLVGDERRLPSTRALAAELGVSRTTVLLALEHLHAEGYLVSRRGSGTFVSEVLPDDAPSAGALRRVARRHKVAADPALGQGSAQSAANPLLPREMSLSSRGRAVAGARPPDRRGREANRAFRLGTPALDVFPLGLWSRITRQCLRGIKAPQLDYSARHGLAALREAIAEQVRWRGTHCDPSQIIVTAGAQRALNLLFQLLLDPGDCVWMEEPGYPGAHAALLASGAQVLPMPVDAHGLELPLPGSRAAMRSRAVRLAYVTPSHQFPLGVAMSLERRRDLLSWAVDSHAWIVEDDYDSEFRYQVKPLPCLHALDAHDRVIYVGSFSKTLFPALRIGFLIAPAHLADELAAARLACDVHPPLLEQAVLAEFMARGDYQRHLRRMRSVYRERLDVLQRSVASCGAPLRLRPVHTGLHAVADLDGVDAERVYREAVLRGIEVMPLSHYYSNSGSPPNGLVLGFGSVQPATLRAGVSQLAQAIEAAGRAAGAERQGAGVAARPPAGAGAPS